jgi:hypothetical protein
MKMGKEQRFARSTALRSPARIRQTGGRRWIEAFFKTLKSGQASSCGLAP